MPGMRTTGQTPQRRVRPLARRQATPSRSSSFFGSLKSFITTPLTWFGPAAVATDDFQHEQDDNGKRRRTGAAPAARTESEGDEAPRVKRQRVEASQQRERATTGYLDPPAAAFSRGGSRAPHGQASRVVSEGNLATRTMSMDPRSSAAPPSLPVRAASAVPTTGESAFPRTSTWQASAQLAAPGTIARDYSMPPVGSVSPTRSQAPFRMRSSFSMTPQPSGQGFGPNLQKREPSEPPSLSSLRANPAFVRNPSQEPGRHQRSVSVQPVLTLGTIAEQSRLSLRQQSTFIVDDQASGHVRAGSELRRSYTPMNATEKALHELDVYKTPLLPTRMRMQSPAAVPEMLRSKKVHVPVLSKRRKGEDDDKPRLGMKRKGEGEPLKDKKLNSSKPYAGESKSGAKKLLARRFREQAEELERQAEEEGDDMIEDEVVEQPKAKQEKLPQVAEESTDEPKKDAFDIPPSEFKVGGSYVSDQATAPSTGRVGRAKTSRTHDKPPQVLQRKGGAARFSAVIEDEDDSMDMSQVEEKETPKPLFAPPANFSFAPPTQSTPSTPAPAASTPVATPSKDAPIDKLPHGFSLKASSTSAFSAIPQINFTPATPEAPLGPKKVDTPAGSTGGVPNFFAKSAAKQTTQVSLPTSASIFSGSPGSSLFGTPASTPPASSEKADEPATFAWGAPKAAEEKADAPKSAFSAAPVAPKAAEETKPSSLFSGFGKPAEAPTSTPVPSLGQKPAEAAAAPAPTTPAFNFGAPSSLKPADAATPSPFSFGQPATAKTEPAPAKVAPASSVGSSMSLDGAAFSQPSAPVPVPAAESLKPAFTFGATPAATPPPDSGAPKSLFGAAPAASTAAPKSLFGAPPAADAQPKPSATTPNSLFSFGQTAAKGEAPKAEAPKPFTFGAAPATPPAAPEKKTGFTFGAPAPAAAPAAPATPAPTNGGFSFSFGATAPAVSSPATEAPKPFTFGASAPAAATPGFGTSTPARPVTPPREDNEVNMDMSPSRSNAVDLYGKSDAPKPATSGFTFGAPSGSALFGNAAPAAPPPIQTSFSFGTTPSQTPTNTGFGFGQPKTEAPATGTPTANTGFNFGQPSAGASGSGTGFSFGGSAKPETPAVSSPFSFGASKPAAPSGGSGFAFGQKQDTPAANSGFNFGGKPTPAPAIQTSLSFGAQDKPSSGFSFGGPTSAPPIAQSFSFGQTASNPGSAPGSPATFTQPTPAFTFGSSPVVPPVNIAGNAFAFGAGSQPASPAPSNSGLPGGGGGFTFGAGASGTPPPSSQGSSQPFGAGGGGGALFTMGAAPTTPGGARQVKKLPTRRTVKR